MAEAQLRLKQPGLTERPVGATATAVSWIQILKQLHNRQDLTAVTAPVLPVEAEYVRKALIVMKEPVVGPPAPG